MQQEFQASFEEGDIESETTQNSMCLWSCDRNESRLVSDFARNILRVMKENGECSTLRLDPQPGILAAALLYNGKLFLSTMSDFGLITYEINKKIKGIVIQNSPRTPSKITGVLHLSSL